MLRNSFLTLVSCLCLSISAVGQYGNEWILYDQDYFKLTVVNDGWYRVTASELEAAGFLTDQVAADRLRLFKNGEEIAMDVTSQNGRLVSFEFYGERNDGQLDQPIYISPDAQPHDYYALFSEATTYFLTYANAGPDGLRMGFSTDNDNSGLIPETFHTAESLLLQTNRYATGRQYTVESLNIPQYDFGEGWSGNLVARNSSQDFSFSLSDIVTSGPDPSLEIVMIGGNNQEHGIDVLVGPDETSLRTLATVNFTGQTSFTFVDDLQWTDISSDGSFLVRASVVGTQNSADQVSFAALKVDYAQAYEVQELDTIKAFELPINGLGRSFLRVNHSNPDDLRFFDITDANAPIRLNFRTNQSPSRAEVVVNGTAATRTILSVRDTKAVPSIQSYRFSEIDLSEANYLIVSHPNLRNPIDGVDPVEAYAAYRASATGGGFNVEITNIQDVYDQFSFGYPSPLAIRNMVQMGFEQGNLDHLFLIGKGLTINSAFYRDRESVPSDGSVNLIPGFGHPGSDLLYVSGFEQGGSIDPVMSVGRITATNPGEVRGYLNKVIEHEAVPYNELWRKRILQLSGGQNERELSIFAGYVRQFARTAANGLLGGSAQNISKGTTENVEFVNINEQVDRGVGMITFFGHSGSFVTDIEVGEVNTFENQGRYPGLFLVNGCNAGEIYGRQESFGEPWVLTENLGAMSFVAHTDLAFARNLFNYSDLLYEVAYEDPNTFGTSIGEIIQEVSIRYLDNSSTNDALSQVFAMVLQGDPALKLFAPESPDFNISANKIEAHAIVGDLILASQDSFRIDVVVENFGRTQTDPLSIRLSQTLPDGTEKQSLRSFPAVAFQDTLSFYVRNELGERVEGNHLFSITLDPNQLIEELDKFNNQATVEVFVSSGSTLALSPINNAVIESTAATLTWQPVNVLEPGRDYELEIDSVNTFNSSFLSRAVINGEGLLSHRPDLSNVPDSSTVFWRTRYADRTRDQDTLWTTSSFTVINQANTDGWGLFDPDQLLEIENNQISYDQANNLWEFDNTYEELEVSTFGGNTTEVPAGSETLFVGNVDLLTTSFGPSVCANNAINVVIFDRRTANPYTPLTGSGLLCGNIPERVYSLDATEILGSNRWLEQLVDAMQTGDQILLFNKGTVDYTAWDNQLRTKLEEVGISSATIEGLVAGQATIFLGTKGASAGSAIATITDNTSRPITEQIIQLDTVSRGTFDAGSLTSAYIGPATSWSNATIDVSTEPSDLVNLDIVGLNTSGEEVTLIGGVVDRQIDLSTIDASTYPFLRAQFRLSDEIDFTPAQLNYMHVQYDVPPDGMLLFPNDEPVNIQEGDTLRASFYFYNYSEQTFQDSVQINTTLLNNEDGSVITLSENILAPAPGDSVRYDLEEDSRGRVGNYNMVVQARPNGTELYSVNNFFSTPNYLDVAADELNPILDITFDGVYILNGDIVSPDPQINIILKDQEASLIKTDTTGISVELKTGDDGTFEQILFGSEQLSFTPATEEEDFSMLYQPGPLEDGSYTLRVRATDESGNRASEVNGAYEIRFEVINESSISHFYPYPNPFSTSTRFVFTLTGLDVPDEIKIQIMTVTGRVVREILQDEIGPIRVGNNITQYAWDGRDEYGNLLANGVYFYRVITNANGQAIERRSTIADRAFKDGYGKLYILR
ncbi:MAG: C25 family cysteine peptidase [Cytophagales bacterium]|nr:C25 family cysteine peptidase [Cytophagales bacterium]